MMRVETRKATLSASRGKRTSAVTQRLAPGPESSDSMPTPAAEPILT